MFFFRWVKNWVDIKYPINFEFGMKDLARRHILDAIYTATANNPNAADHLIDPNGEMRFKVNQLMSGFIRDFGMDDDLEEKILKCEKIYGPIFS